MRKLFYIITMLVTCLFFLNSNPLYAKSGCEAPKQGPQGPPGPPGPQGAAGGGGGGGITSMAAGCFIPLDEKAKQSICHLDEPNPAPDDWPQVQFNSDFTNVGPAFKFIKNLDDFTIGVEIIENGVYLLTYNALLDNTGGVLAVVNDTLDALYACSIMDDGSGNNPLFHNFMIEITNIDGIIVPNNFLRIVNITTVGQGIFKTIKLHTNNTPSTAAGFTIIKLVPLPFAG